MGGRAPQGMPLENTPCDQCWNTFYTPWKSQVRTKSCHNSCTLPPAEATGSRGILKALLAYCISLSAAARRLWTQHLDRDHTESKIFPHRDPHFPRIFLRHQQVWAGSAHASLPQPGREAFMRVDCAFEAPPDWPAVSWLPICPRITD